MNYCGNGKQRILQRRLYRLNESSHRRRRNSYEHWATENDGVQRQVHDVFGERGKSSKAAGTALSFAGVFDRSGGSAP